MHILAYDIVGFLYTNAIRINGVRCSTPNCETTNSKFILPAHLHMRIFDTVTHITYRISARYVAVFSLGAHNDCCFRFVCISLNVARCNIQSMSVSRMSHGIAFNQRGHHMWNICIKHTVYMWMSHTRTCANAVETLLLIGKHDSN